MPLALAMGNASNKEIILQIDWGVYLRAAHPEPKTVEGVNFISPKDVAIMLALHQAAEGTGDDSPAACQRMAEYAECAGKLATRAQEQNGKQRPEY